MIQSDRNAKRSIAVTLSFVAAGTVSLLTGMCWLIVRPDILATYHYNQHVIAVTHLFTLGWICSAVMGSIYQLVPVALETNLHSERLARAHFLLHLIGFTGMVWMFRAWNIKGVGYFGFILATGVLVFAYNIGRTLTSILRWNVVAVGIASALGWLVLAILAGLLVAAAKLWPISSFDPIRQMHAHAHLGGLGFLMILIVAVSYKLIPMFGLSELQNQSRAWTSLALLNVGMAGLFVTILFGSALKLLFAIVVISGLGLFGCELIAILRVRKRRIMDWGMKYFLTAIALLAPLCVLAIVLSSPGVTLNDFTGRLENVYGLIALLGVVTLAILGMLYKIVPFLVWYSRYSPDIGRMKVPALVDLYSVRLQTIGYWLFLGGLVLTSLATLFGHAACAQKGAALWFASIIVFAANMVKISHHLFKPGTESLPMNAALKGVS
ncbi:MAG TPA: hypothetical protein VM735_03495 [Candidatus Kapabacteria bacterium]|nr:hypothetical protein [Candidatus Kapabacteria bacterium]